MKKLGRPICPFMVLLIVLSCWNVNVAAQDETTLPLPEYPKARDKAWYDNPEKVAPFTWTDEWGVEHENKVSDPAGNTMHIIALLSYVYTNPDIPGLKYAIPDSADLKCYKYIPQANVDFVYDGYDQYGLPTYNGKPVRTQNLTTTIDYDRHVNEKWYTGDVTIENDYTQERVNYELTLKSGRNGLGLWTLGGLTDKDNPFFENGAWPSVNSNNLPVAEDNMPYTQKPGLNKYFYNGAPQPVEHGLTIFLVKLKDTYGYAPNNDGRIVGSPATNTSNYKVFTPGDIVYVKVKNADGTYRTEPVTVPEAMYGMSSELYTAISNEIDSVILVTNAVRIEDDHSKETFNSGTLYNVTSYNMNHFYFMAKGKARQSVKMPTTPLFEEFSPISSLQDGTVSDFYNELMSGKVFTMQHDCSSVPETAHAFSMHGLFGNSQSDHRNVEGVALWIPDYRMKYWQWKDCDDSNSVYYGYMSKKHTDDDGNTTLDEKTLREGFGRDLFKLYDNVYRDIRYFNYNPLHAPSLALYTCQLAAETMPYTGDSPKYDHPYNVNLDWSTTVSKIASSNNGIPEDFEIYRVVDGVREDTPLFTFIWNPELNDYCEIKYDNHSGNLFDGSVPSTEGRSYFTSYQVPQFEDHGYWITYQVFSRVNKPLKEGQTTPEVFNTVLSNTDRVWIPPYEGSGAVKLNLEVNASSAYDREKEVNRYVNTINIINNPENPLKVGDVFMRNNNQGWNPYLYNGLGGFDSNTDQPTPQQDPDSWIWEDNNMGSEIIVYRFDTKTPSVKLPIARVYFNCLVDRGAWDQYHRFRFAVGRDNQAETAKEEDYIYTDDDIDRPWEQSCDISNYDSETAFPFNYNHGYEFREPKVREHLRYYNKGLMVTDVFEVSTAQNDHPSQYGYVAEFHRHSNIDAPNYSVENVVTYQHVEFRSNQVTVDVYKSNSESSEHTFTLSEITGDTDHSLELDYKAGLTVNNMLYLPEVDRYSITRRDGEVGGYAQKDTQSNYIVYSNDNKVDEPSQYQSRVTIPDKTRESTNVDHIDYVPVITAKLPGREYWMTGVGDKILESTYGSNYHGTDNNVVWLEEDIYHDLAQQYAGEAATVAPQGNATEYTIYNGRYLYGNYLKISSDMSRDLEVYGVRVWRVRECDHNGNREDVLVNQWFNVDGMDEPAEMPQSCYFLVNPNSNGNLMVTLKDAYEGPHYDLFKANDIYQPKYIVRFYARLKEEGGTTPRRNIAPRADEQEAKIYYVSEDAIFPDYEDDIPTSISESVICGDIESVTYFDGLGRKSNRPFQGLNIVVTRRTDGTVTKTKMMVK